MAIFNTKLTVAEKEIAKELFGRRYSENLDRNVVYTQEEELHLMTIKRLMYEGNINGAEDTLFDKIGRIKGENYIYIALEFYAGLYEMGDEKLKKFGFSEEEIFQGVTDIKSKLGLSD